MKKRFVVCLNSSTSEQNKSFTEFIRESKLTWWHWLANTWLIVDKKGSYTAREIRDAVKRSYPGVHTIVLEITGGDDTWSGFGPNQQDKNMFEWLREHWKA